MLNLRNFKGEKRPFTSKSLYKKYTCRERTRRVLSIGRKIFVNLSSRIIIKVMWSTDHVSEIFDHFFRSSSSSIFSYLIIICFVFTPPFASCSKEFSAFRLSNYELHGTQYGSTGSLLNLESRILPGSPIIGIPRRCYVIKLLDLTIAMYRDLLKANVGGILIIVPQFSELRDTLTDEQKDQIQELEQLMLFEQTTIPIYFILENGDSIEIYDTVKKSAESLNPSSSGFQTLLQHIIGNGVQLVSSLGTPKALTDPFITNIQGSLIGSKVNKNFPILISAHYDSQSPAAELAKGADANGSGTAMLLELARLFSHLYTQRGGTSVVTSKKTGRPHNSLLFLLSGAGHFNYEGTQKYLEDQIESTENSDLQDVRLVICLDALAGNKDKIYMHVSRSIREGTMLNTFINNLIESANKLYPEIKVELVQKKVRTEGLLTWEHEKFHLKKLNAITLSSHENSNLVRPSMLDTKDFVDLADLTKKTHVISEAVAATLYNVSSLGRAFEESPKDTEESIDSLLEYITSQPRAAQLLSSKNNKIVLSLKSLLARYTHETNIYHTKPDKRDANLVFYDSTSGILTAYEVKPAVFDLVLSFIIAVYIGLIYLVIKQFPKIYDNLSYISTPSTTNGTNHHNVNQSKSKVQ